MADELAKKYELTSVLVENVHAGEWGIGETPRDVAAHLEVTITAGTNTHSQKAAFLKQAMMLLRQFMPALHEATYVVLREIPATDWGYDGVSQAYRASQMKPAQ